MRAGLQSASCPSSGQPNIPKLVYISDGLKNFQPSPTRTAIAYTESVSVKLPAGFLVDEMPDPVKLETSFGSYVTTYEVKDGQLLFTRKLVQRAATIPVEQYASVQNFFERIRAAELAPVVLARR